MPTEQTAQTEQTEPLDQAEQPAQEQLAQEQPAQEQQAQEQSVQPESLEQPGQIDPPEQALQPEADATTGSSSRALAALIGIVAIVAITAAIAFAMGLIGPSSSHQGEADTSRSSNGMPEGASTTAEEVAAKLAGYGGDAGTPWAQSSVERPAEDVAILPGVGGITGTWVCRDYDFDGATYTFQATFSDTGTFAVWLYDVDGDDEAHFAGLRTFHVEEDQVVEDGGFVFTVGAEDTITLHVSDENKPHQEKDTYVFARKTIEPETLKQLSWAVGNWYAQDETGETIYLAMNGYWYNGNDQLSGGCWYILDNDVILEGDAAAGTSTTTLKYMSAAYNVLVHIDTERIYGWEPPSEEDLAAQAAQQQ